METMHELRKFGYLMAIAFVAISILRFAIHHSFSFWWLAIAGLFAISSLIYPPILRPIYRGWMKLADLLSWMMTRIILIIAFYLIVTPISLIASVCGKKFLALDFEKNRETYWQPRTNDKAASADNQF